MTPAKLIGACIIFLALLPMQLMATSQDNNEPMLVEADHLEVRDQDNLSIYSGNVRFEQGTLLMQADRLIIHFSDDKDLELMEMTGNPATFQQMDDNAKETRGEADKLDYYDSKSLLVLQGNARFSSDTDTIESSTIRINTETHYIEADSPEADKRVRMVIQPKVKDEAKNEVKNEANNNQ